MARTPLPLRLIRAGFATAGRVPALGGPAALRLFQTPVGARVAPSESPRMRAAVDLFASGERAWLTVDAGLPVGAGRPSPVRVRAYRFGPSPEAGAPRLLLVHGFTSRALHLAAYVRAALDAGWSVSALDLPGHGESPGRRCPAPVAARAIRALARRDGPVTAVLGHSFGGAMTALAVDPDFEAEERLAVRRAVLLAAPDALADVTRRFADTVGLAPAARLAFERRLARQNGRPVEAFKARDIWAGLDLPLLVVHDRGDAEVPFADGQAVALRAKARTRFTEGLGHRKVLYDPGTVAAVMAFLAEG